MSMPSELPRKPNTLRFLTVTCSEHRIGTFQVLESRTTTPSNEIFVPQSEIMFLECPGQRLPSRIPRPHNLMLLPINENIAPPPSSVMAVSLLLPVTPGFTLP